LKKLFQTLWILKDASIQRESSKAGEGGLEILDRNTAKNKIIVVWPCYADGKWENTKASFRYIPTETKNEVF
jgi:hypothetical protein